MLASNFIWLGLCLISALMLPGASTLTVCSFNVCKTEHLAKQDNFRQVLQREAIQIAEFQRTTATVYDISNYQTIANYNIQTLTGTALILIQNLKYGNLFLRESGRLIYRVVQNIAIIVCYVNSGASFKAERDSFFYHILGPEIHKFHNLPIIILADLSATRNAEDSTTESNLSVDLQKYLQNFGVWREAHPFGMGATFFYPQGSSRIYVLFSSMYF